MTGAGAQPRNVLYSAVGLLHTPLVAVHSYWPIL
jgi:hypothetical protein